MAQATLPAAPRPIPPGALPRQAPGSPPAPLPRLGEAIPPGLKPSTRTPAPATGVAQPRIPPQPPLSPPPPVRASTPTATTTGHRYGLSVVAGKAKGARYRVPATGATLGQSQASIVLAEDPYVSPHHLSLLIRDGTLYVRDEASASGVYVSLNGVETLAPGTFFCAGAHLFRYAGPVSVQPPPPGRPLPYGAPLPGGQALFSLEEILVGGRVGRTILTAGPLLTIGQAGCDLSFPTDKSMAPRHCELRLGPAGALLRNLSGGLGTFVRIPPRQERPVRAGDHLRVGLHILQVESPT